MERRERSQDKKRWVGDRGKRLDVWFPRGSSCLPRAERIVGPTGSVQETGGQRRRESDWVWSQTGFGIYLDRLDGGHGRDEINGRS